MENILDLCMLIALQVVLGFDNLLYISIESKRVALRSQQRVRIWGIGLAVIFRIGLLFVLTHLMRAFQEPAFRVDWQWIDFSPNFSSLITFLGGAFIIYTAIKEVTHMLHIESVVDEQHARKPASALRIIALIVAMNMVFSFDSILSALAITDVFWVMASAIIVSGVLMVVMAQSVSDFLQRNRLYEVLGLFILLIVGVMLVSEGGHQAHAHFFGFPVEAMSKTTFYFVIVVLVLVDVVQGRYQKAILARAKKTALPRE